MKATTDGPVGHTDLQQDVAPADLAPASLPMEAVQLTEEQEEGGDGARSLQLPPQPRVARQEPQRTDAVQQRLAVRASVAVPEHSQQGGWGPAQRQY